MSWRAVARNDLRGALAARSVWILTVGLVALLAGLGYAVPRLRVSAEAPFTAYLDVVVPVVVLLFPLIGLLLGYRSIVAGRESGTATLALSLPNSRYDLVFGKFVGRATALAGSLAVAGGVAAIYLFASYNDFALGNYFLVLLLTFAYTLTFLGISVGFSTAIASPRKVMGAAFGAYVLLVMFWWTLIDVVVLVLFRFQQPLEMPIWAELAKFVHPGTSVRYLFATEIGVGSAPPESVVGTGPFVSTTGALTGLIAWIALPAVLGYVQFRRSEL